MSGNDVGKELAGPQRAEAVFDERQNDHDKEQRDGWESFFFPDSGLMEERSDPQVIEGIVDLGFDIKAMLLYFPLDGQRK